MLQKYSLDSFIQFPSLKKYEILKKSYGDSYDVYKDQILTTFSKSNIEESTLIKIFLLENESKRIVDFFSQSRHFYLYDENFSALFNIIPELLYEAYKTEVFNKLEGVYKDRSTYKEVIKHIRKMTKIYPDRIEAVITDIRTKYAKRRALLDELNSL
jgi:tetratricopeptide (TPR) repeat protein